MILRCSDRALADRIARDNLRVTALWEELDAIQLEIEDAIAIPFDHDRYASLALREGQILAELDRIDS